MSGNIYNRSFFSTIVIATFFLLAYSQTAFSISIEWMRDLDFVDDYHESGNLGVTGFAVTDDGNVIVGGNVGAFNDPLWLAELNADLDSVLWLTTFEAEETAWYGFTQLIIDDRNNCIILGNYGPQDHVQDPVSPAIFMIAADSEGDSAWSFSYEVEYHPEDITFQPDRIREALAIPDNGYVLCGQGQRLQEYQADHLLMLFVDEEGELTDEFRYSPGDSTFLNIWGIKQTNDDEIVVCAGARGPVPPYLGSRHRGVAVKVSLEGELIWYNEYTAYDDYIAYISGFSDFIELPNSDMVFCGRTSRRSDLDDDKYWLAKVDEDGELDWSRTYDLGGEKSSVFTDIFEADGQFVCFGRFISEDDDIDRIILAVFDRDGDLIDEFMFPEEFVARNLDQVIEVAEGEYICKLAGRLLAKVNLIDNSAPALTDPPRDFNIISAYPNPFNSQFKVDLDLYETSRLSLKLFDNLGRIVSSSDEATLNPGRKSLTLNTAHLPAGAYLLQVDAGRTSQTRRVTLVR